MIEPSVTQKTAALVEEWIRAKKAAARVQQFADQAEDQLKSAIAGLCAWLAPADAKVGETFNLWHGNGILAAMLEHKGAISKYYQVSWRKEPTGKQLAEKGA